MNKSFFQSNLSILPYHIKKSLFHEKFEKVKKKQLVRGENQFFAQNEIFYHLPFLVAPLLMGY